MILSHNVYKARNSLEGYLLSVSIVVRNVPATTAEPFRESLHHIALKWLTSCQTRKDGTASPGFPLGPRTGRHG